MTESTTTAKTWTPFTLSDRARSAIKVALSITLAFLFPMAVVPNAWGLWNMLYLAVGSRSRLPLGIFGALLVLVLVPGGVALTRLLDSFAIQMDLAIPMVPIGMGVYYLAWKYAVGPLNAEMGIA